jgi:ubiquinone/menaquinone biosynthesis C-methylase UbiE
MDEVIKSYLEVQKLPNTEVVVNRDDLVRLSEAWRADDIPDLQSVVSDCAVKEFRSGEIVPVFSSLVRILKRLSRKRIATFLDLACATGYYKEVVGSVLGCTAYHGADYSRAMIDKALAKYPGTPFTVQDATDLTFQDRSFDVVMLSGALEHIPHYERAIQQLCRVSAKWVILHRLPVHAGKSLENIHTVGVQYSIRTPRTYFSLDFVINEFRKHGFRMVLNAPTYKPSWKNFIKTALSISVPERDTRSLLLVRGS